MATNGRPLLTPARLRVLAAVQRLVDAGPWPPTVREVAGALGLSPHGVHESLWRLERDGWLRRDGPRGITLLRRVVPVCEIKGGEPVPTGELLVVELKRESGGGGVDGDTQDE